MKKPVKRSRTHGKKSPKRSSASGLRVVAIFEGAKGALVLVPGCGLLLFIHKDLHEAAVRLVEHIHLNPARHYPHIFIDLTENITNSQLWTMAAAALIYSSVRFVEAAGLWMEKKWAAWFGALTGGLYIPLEVFELTRGVIWPKITVLVVNLGVVLYLLFELKKNRDTGNS